LHSFRFLFSKLKTKIQTPVRRGRKGFAEDAEEVR
jgi:hypothetical protein